MRSIQTLGRNGNHTLMPEHLEQFFRNQGDNLPKIATADTRTFGLDTFMLPPFQEDLFYVPILLHADQQGNVSCKQGMNSPPRSVHTYPGIGPLLEIHFQTPKMAVVCAGFAVRADSSCSFLARHRERIDNIPRVIKWREGWLQERSWQADRKIRIPGGISFFSKDWMPQRRRVVPSGSPHSCVFWQVQGEKEEKRPGSTKRKFQLAAMDIAAGVISGTFVAYFIILSTAATLLTQHQQIHTALDAARVLEPLVGPLAEYLFALGLIGAGIIAIPVLLASASYGVAGTIGWPSGLPKKPWQNEGFYLILTVGLAVSLLLALIGLDPLHLMFWANVLQGVLSPILVVLLMVMGNSRRIMDKNRLGWFSNAGLVAAAIVMFGASVLLFYGLATGQGGE
jgi:hypothetical protein